MSEAITMAKLAFKNDEVPVGAIVVYNGKIIGRGFNQVIAKSSVCSQKRNRQSKYGNRQN